MTVMDHQQALRTHAAERYTLRDMPEEEAEQFEQHFFGCETCAADLQTLRAMAVNGREAGKVLAFPGRRENGWRRWTPMAAAAGWAVAAFLGWRQFTGHEAEGMATFALKSVTRGEPNPVAVPAGTERFAVYFDVVWDARPDRYRILITDMKSGALRSELIAAPPADGQAMFLLLNRNSLPPGLYKITVADPAGARLADLEFDMRLKP